MTYIIHSIVDWWIHRYKDGVVVGADSRTSVSGYVSNRYANKISFILEDDFGIYASPVRSKMQLNSAYLLKPHGLDDGDDDETEDTKQNKNTSMVEKKYSSTCCICRSGSAADTQYLADSIRYQLLRRKVLHSTSSSISETAHLIKNYVSGKDELSASLICAGYDHVQDEGLIYSIDLGGTLMEQKGWACNGSGSAYILGLIDNSYPTSDKNLWDEEEAVTFVKSAIRAAMERDGSSGGVVRIFVINKDGKRGILCLPEGKFDNRSHKSGKLPHFASPIKRQ